MMFSFINTNQQTGNPSGSALSLVLMKSVGPVGAEPSLLVTLAGFWFLAVSVVSHFVLTVMWAFFPANPQRVKGFALHGEPDPSDAKRNSSSSPQTGALRAGGNTNEKQEAVGGLTRSPTTPRSK